MKNPAKYHKVIVFSLFVLLFLEAKVFKITPVVAPIVKTMEIQKIK